MPFTVATWNLLHTELEQRDVRLREAAAHLRAAAPDIVLVQEAVVRSDRDVDAATDLAALLGMTVAARATTGYPKTPHAATPNRSDTAVLTQWPVLDRFEVPVEEGSAAAGATLTHPNGRPIVALSAHLPWGGRREGARLAAAQGLEAAAAAKAAALAEAGQAPLTILGGDFNALPESSTVRYLTGLQPAPDGSGAFWIDAWATAATGRQAGDGGATVVPANPWARWTAQNGRIDDPYALPDRRIDYLLVRDWVYGQFGHPDRVELLGVDALTGVFASDHYGLVATLRDDQ